jgi:hypothetical protein
MQHCQVALPETPSNVVTLDGPLLIFDRSIELLNSLPDI